MNHTDSNPDPIKARVMSAIKTNPSRTRREATRRAIALVAIAASLALGIFAAIGGPAKSSVIFEPDVRARPLLNTLAIAGGWALASSILTWFATSRGDSPLGRRPALLATIAIATPLLLFAWMHAFVGAYPEPYAAIGYKCFRYTLAMGAAPLAAFLAIRAKSDPRAPSALGAAGGAVCGAWAALLVDLWCPLVNTPHVLFGHVLPMIILVGLGAIIGRRVLGVRRM